MGKIESSSKLNQLKEELVKILDERIAKARVNEEISSLSDLTLGGIINVFEGITDKLYEAKGGKKLIAKYVKTIRESKALSNAYSTYEIIYKAPNVTNSQLFLSEAISMSKCADKKAYNEAKAKLASVVSECVKLVGTSSEDISANAHKNDTINEAVEYLLLNEKKHSNLSEYVNKFDFVKTALEEGMRPLSENKENLTGKELIENLNEEFSGLKDYEKETLKDITLALLSESDFSQLFESYKNKCVEKLDEYIENTDSFETRSHFEQMKSQLLGKEFKQESIYEDLFTLAELSKTLVE